MEYPELYPILEELVIKYRDIKYNEWKKLLENCDRFNDYSDEEFNSKFFWQAHTEVLEIEVNEHGNYAHISFSIYPENVHSMPPAPGAGMFVYESGWCDVGTPLGEYTYDQKSKIEEKITK